VSANTHRRQAVAQKLRNSTLVEQIPLVILIPFLPIFGISEIERELTDSLRLFGLSQLFVEWS
jgi:hypothetical protein